MPSCHAARIFQGQHVHSSRLKMLVTFQKNCFVPVVSYAKDIYTSTTMTIAISASPPRPFIRRANRLGNQPTEQKTLYLIAY